MSVFRKNEILLHSLVAKHSTFAMDLDIAEVVGFDGIEMSAEKLKAFLAAGYSVDELRAISADVNIPGIGFLIDIERQGVEKVDLLAAAKEIFELATVVGARGVQVLTGPVNVQAVISHLRGQPDAGIYAGLIGKSENEQLELTAKNLAELADLAKEYGLLLYLEALAWTPLNTIAKQLALIERAGRENVRIVVDFWHCYASGDTPDVVAKIPRDLIFGVHICDSLLFEGGTPNEDILRDVPTGKGILNLKDWVGAVKSTGFDGWWSCELFCKKQHQQNSYDVARELKALMRSLIAS